MDSTDVKEKAANIRDVLGYFDKHPGEIKVIGGKTQRQWEKEAIKLVNKDILPASSPEVGNADEAVKEINNFFESLVKKNATPPFIVTQLERKAKEAGLSKAKTGILSGKLAEAIRREVTLRPERVREIAEKFGLNSKQIEGLLEIVPKPGEPPKTPNVQEQVVYETPTPVVVETPVPPASAPISAPAPKIDINLGKEIPDVGGKVVEKAADTGEKLANLGIEAGAKSAEAALAATGVGAIGAVIVEVGKRLLKNSVSWVKRKIVRHKKSIALGALMGAGAWWLLGSPLAGLAGALGGFAIGGLATGTTAAVVGTIGTALGSLFVSTAASLVVPTLIALIILPLFVIFTSFVINSGAYVVPPDNSAGGPGSVIIGQGLSQNPYIGIKIEPAEGISQISNSDLPKTATYNVTISALTGSLTDIQIFLECSVFKSGTSPECSGQLPSDIPQVIDPTTPYTFSFDQLYTPVFSDSVAANTIKVNANVGGGTEAGTDNKQNAQATHSLLIGEPSTGCFTIDGEWDPGRRSMVQSAITTLSSSFPAYMAKLCGSGQNIRIVFINKQTTYYGWHKGNTIELYPGAFISTTDVLHTLAHESGHHMGYFSAPGLYTQYVHTPGVASERPLCSYSNTTVSEEAFAEGIALYVTRESSDQWHRHCSAKSSFQSAYPAHYSFMRDVIFK